MLWRPMRSAVSLALVLCLVPYVSSFSVGIAARGFMGRAVRAERRAPQAAATSSQWTMQVWSNEQAVKEYRDFLDGKRQDDTNDGPSVIIGEGRLGTMLKDAGGGSGDKVVRRGDSIPLELDDGVKDFPLYVCVPEDEVENVIKACPKEKLDDLVFCQKGNIETLLKKYALCGNENTQILNSFHQKMLPYFSIYNKDARPMSQLEEMGTDAYGKTKYAGETVICGKWKGAVAQRLDRIGLPSKHRGYYDYRRDMVEHCVFESVYNLVGLLHKEIPLGEVGLYHQRECEDLIFEMNRALRGSMAITLLSGVEERCLALSQGPNVEMRKAELKDFKWYNGFFYKMSLDARDFEVYGKKVDMPDPMPMHSEYLEYAKEQGLIDFELEPYRVSYD